MSSTNTSYGLTTTWPARMLYVRAYIITWYIHGYMLRVCTEVYASHCTKWTHVLLFRNLSACCFSVQLFVYFLLILFVCFYDLLCLCRSLMSVCLSLSLPVSFFLSVSDSHPLTFSSVFPLFSSSFRNHSFAFPLSSLSVNYLSLSRNCQLLHLENYFLTRCFLVCPNLIFFNALLTNLSIFVARSCDFRKWRVVALFFFFFLFLLLFSG